MPKYSFSFEGLDGLKKDMDEMLDKYPDETEKEMYRLAGVFTKDVNDKMPASYKKGKRPIPNEWHRSRERGIFAGYTVGIEIQNGAPHWHLVENGHEVIADPKKFAAYQSGKLDSKKRNKTRHMSRNKLNPNLKNLGWSPGKGYCQITRDEWDSGRFTYHILKFLSKMKKKHHL